MRSFSAVVARAAAIAHLRATFTWGVSSKRERGRSVRVGFGVGVGVAEPDEGVGDDEAVPTGCSSAAESPPPQEVRPTAASMAISAVARSRLRAGARVRDVVTVSFFPPWDGAARNS